jgi:hypothetical protein
MDKIGIYYADTFPSTLTEFCRDVAQGDKRLLLCFADTEVAGALWLHDLVRQEEGIVVAGWVGCYFLPDYRGPLVNPMWQLARQYWESVGVEHFFSAVHVANRSSQMITRSTRFHRVGRFPRFMQCQGRPVDVMIYTLHGEDMTLAWQLASARAARQISRIL